MLWFGRKTPFFFAHRCSWHSHVLRLINSVGGCWLFDSTGNSQKCGKSFSFSLFFSALTQFSALFVQTALTSLFWNICISQHLFHFEKLPSETCSCWAQFFHVIRRPLWREVELWTRFSREETSWDTDATIAAVWQVPLKIPTVKKERAALNKSLNAEICLHTKRKVWFCLLGSSYLDCCVIRLEFESKHFLKMPLLPDWQHLLKWNHHKTLPVEFVLHPTNHFLMRQNSHSRELITLLSKWTHSHMDSHIYFCPSIL